MTVSISFLSLELKNGPIDFLKPLSVVDSRLVLTSASREVLFVGRIAFGRITKLNI